VDRRRPLVESPRPGRRRRQNEIGRTSRIVGPAQRSATGPPAPPPISVEGRRTPLHGPPARLGWRRCPTIWPHTNVPPGNPQTARRWQERRGHCLPRPASPAIVPRQSTSRHLDLFKRRGGTHHNRPSRSRRIKEVTPCPRPFVLFPIHGRTSRAGATRPHPEGCRAPEMDAWVTFPNSSGHQDRRRPLGPTTSGKANLALPLRSWPCCGSPTRVDVRPGRVTAAATGQIEEPWETAGNGPSSALNRAPSPGTDALDFRRGRPAIRPTAHGEPPRRHGHEPGDGLAAALSTGCPFEPAQPAAIGGEWAACT